MLYYIISFLSTVPFFGAVFYFIFQLAFVGGLEILKKIKALLVRVRLELSSRDSIIYFVVKRPYDIILTLNEVKVKKNSRILENLL